MFTVSLGSVSFAFLLSATALGAAIVGTPKNDVIRGTAKADRINGRTGDDKLYGLGGNDALIGGSGNDTLVGGVGRDTLQCGTGRDTAIADASDNVSADCETVRSPVLPSISIADASVAEGNSGTTPLAFEVTLSRRVTWKVSVSYATADGTANVGSDYAGARSPDLCARRNGQANQRSGQRRFGR
jgi:Ca2+-binding RTX toxin-like protein